MTTKIKQIEVEEKVISITSHKDDDYIVSARKLLTRYLSTVYC